MKKLLIILVQVGSSICVKILGIQTHEESLADLPIHKNENFITQIAQVGKCLANIDSGYGLGFGSLRTEL